MEKARKLKIICLSDIGRRLNNTRKILLNMEKGDISGIKQNSFSTSNAVYIFINCLHPENAKGILADQVIIDFREPMISIAREILKMSCVPEEYQIIDDRRIYT